MIHTERPRSKTTSNTRVDPCPSSATMFLTVERGVVSTLDPYGATSSPCSAGTVPHRGRQRYAQGRVFCAYVGSDTYPLRGILIHRYAVPLPLLGEGNATRMILISIARLDPSVAVAPSRMTAGKVSMLDPYGTTSSVASRDTFPHRGRQRFAHDPYFHRPLRSFGRCRSLERGWGSDT